MKTRRQNDITPAVMAAGAVLLASALTLLPPRGNTAAESTDAGGGTDGGSGRFTTEVMNGHTPVKDQGRTPLCWAYAMLSTIETEHIMRGDSVSLSVKYAARKALEDNAQRYYLCGDRKATGMRGTGHTLLHAIERHGIVPYSAYGDSNTDAFNTLRGGARHLAKTAARSRTGTEWLAEKLRRAADEALGPTPHRVFMLGAEYTPQEFGRSVCAPGEYIALTSFTHHPFYASVDLEIPDNYARDRFMNVPADTLTAVVERAVRAGHGVCWEGDISEPGFSFARGTAVLTHSADLSEGARQRAFERFETTDDHCMAIVGLARDTGGELFYIMKNSWGTDNPYGGLMYVSAGYVRMKTVAVFLPASVLTAAER